MEVTGATPGDASAAAASAALLHPTSAGGDAPPTGFCLRAKYVETGEEEVLAWSFVFQNR